MWMAASKAARSCERVLNVGARMRVGLHVGKAEEVGRPMQLVVELLWDGELQVVLHGGRVPDAHEVVVPDLVLGHHVEAHEAVREKELHLLVVRGQVALRVCRRVAVLAAPLVARGGQLVGREGHGAGGEGHGEDHRALAVPRLVVRHDARVHVEVRGRELGHLVGLCVEPPQRLHALEVLVVGDGRGHVHLLVRAPLGHEDDAADLLDLGVVGRAHAVHVAHHLRAEVRDADELLEEVLGEHVRVAVLRAVLGAHVDVGRAEVQVGGGDGAHAPVRLARVGLLLVLAARGHDELLAVLVDGLCGDRIDLRGLAVLLDLGNLLALLRGRRDLHAQDDVPNLRLGEARHVDVVLLAVVREDEVLEGHLQGDPLLVAEGGPDVVGLRHRVLVRLHEHLGALVVHVEGPQDEDEPGEGRVGGDALEPVVVDVEEQHLGLGGLEDEVPELLDLEARLEGQLELRALDHDVWEVEEVYLQGVQHALARGDDLLGLLLDGHGPDERRHLLGGLPLCELPEALLARPDGGVDDLEEELARARVEDEDGPVDGLCRQVALERLVDGHAVHVGVVHKPDDLVAEELPVVLAGQVGLRGLRRVELQALADALPEHVQGRVGLHDLGEGLGGEGLHPGHPVAVGRVEVVGQVEPHHHTRGGRVDGHVVRGVVEELSPRVALDVMRVVVAPAQLHVHPVL
mmetsp:Transcript_8475/g.28819  ORF Transcript_8475/g.28819 Transcript_8475/m.28819 type:complete len:688 (+) Transcript_8475:1085-3148(+)